MNTTQQIDYDGRPAAVVIGERALIGDELPAAALAIVRAKCLYALQINAGERPGPYTDHDAVRYSRHATAPRESPRHSRGQ